MSYDIEVVRTISLDSLEDAEREFKRLNIAYAGKDNYAIRGIYNAPLKYHFVNGKVEKLRHLADREYVKVGEY